ncbi:nucleotidyl transferase AbiEii/AbiGii toxin family protein, partial [Streptomyces sp. NPDC006996]|uniref:nucleotidyl transferase AbiEii/AbiGii toxin family protein n=1 Tax=Streptomyces sp. NPDC006996 TaxID=3156908 RepID=UPI0033BFC403
MSVAELLRIFYFNRLAARVFTKEPDSWLIKGGQALLVRYRGAARLSTDIDLQCAHPDRTAEEARQLVIEAASLDLGDYLRYRDYSQCTGLQPGGEANLRTALTSAVCMDWH